MKYNSSTSSNKRANESTDTRNALQCRIELNKLDFSNTEVYSWRFFFSPPLLLPNHSTNMHFTRAKAKFDARIFTLVLREYIWIVGPEDPTLSYRLLVTPTLNLKYTSEHR